MCGRERFLWAAARPMATAAAMFCIAVVAVAQTPRPRAASTAFHEELIAAVTSGSEFKQELLGEDHVAWVEARDNNRTVRLDGKQQGGTYDEVKYLAFGRDEQRLAFFGKRGGTWILVLDGQEGSQRYTNTSSVSFQPHGDSYAYSACQEKKKCQLFVDGAPTGAEYQGFSYPRYSRDGKRLAFFGKRGDKWIAVVDGKEVGPELDDFWYAAWGFTRDGSRFYAPGRLNDKWTYLIDGVAGPGFDVISRVAFSRDGQHWAYAGTDAKAGFTKQQTVGTVVMDGKTKATYQGSGMPGLWTLFGGATTSMSSGVHDLSPRFHGIAAPVFDSEGKLFYAARRGEGDVAVVSESEAGPGFDDILSPIVFSLDSNHLVFVARRGDAFVEVRDNRPGATFSPSRHKAADVRWIMISRDAAHVAYETVSGGDEFRAGRTQRAVRSVVLDSRAGPEYDAFHLDNFDFSKDARHYHYEVHGVKGERDLVNVDGHESRLYDTVANTRFSADGNSVVFLARDGRRFLRVAYAFEPANPETATPQAAPQ